jgi:hypothetical protein
MTLTAEQTISVKVFPFFVKPDDPVNVMYLDLTAAEVVGDYLIVRIDGVPKALVRITP